MKKYISPFLALLFNSFICCFVLVSHLTSFSQQIQRSSIGAMGNPSNANGIKFKQSVGQPAIVTHEKNDDGTGLRQGFLQPGTSTIDNNELNVNLFSNPNQGEFAFQVNVENDIKFNYQLFDQSGKLIEFNSASGNSLVTVRILKPVQGLYQLKISTTNKTSSFKIIVIP
jgi:hypothetical protein